mgnify:CR=1 FL=1
MPLIGLAEPTNCWPLALQAFADALAASEAFGQIVARPEQTDPVDPAEFVFGRRLTISRNGRAWTAAELAELRAYGMVQSVNYGKHMTAAGCYLPHGATAVAVCRLVPASELIDVGLGPQPSDASDRNWQNLVGLVPEQVIAYLRDQGGPWPIGDVELTVDDETDHEARPQQGLWQEAEWLFAWGREL